jgi:AcrR family transcriptional regulator
MPQCGMPARGNDLRQALLDGVRDAVREHGASALSLRDVARRAGVSHAAPAHYFGSKSGLLTAFAVEGFSRMATTVLEEIAATAPNDGPSTLAAIGRGYVRFAIGSPSHFEVMFRVDALDAASPELARVTDATYALLSDTIMRCDREGALDRRDPALVAISAWSLVHGLASLWISGWLEGRAPTSDPEELGAAVAALFVEAVLSPS